MQAELREGAALFSACWNAPIERVAIENPVMHRHANGFDRELQACHPNRAAMVVLVTLPSKPRVFTCAACRLCAPPIG